MRWTLAPDAPLGNTIKSRGVGKCSEQDFAKDFVASVVSLDEDNKRNAKRMKNSHYFTVLLIALAPSLAFCQAQPGPIMTPPGMPVRGARSGAEESKLTKFNLDFPGGTPKQLVAAIEKAMGKPLNAIVPDEDADMKLPPLKMSQVDVPQLFDALTSASRKTVVYDLGMPGMAQQRQVITSYGFQTQNRMSDDSVWVFYVEKPIQSPRVSPPKVCRFYALSPYLERGLTVDDITTAIKTGWKMEGDTNTPAISFHPETKLLIAVGEASKLETIDAVLKALTPPTPPAEKKPETKPGEKKAEK